ncbi:aminopeptidase N [Daphnia magna]|uniref:aminopeptidase N n=1 Tax=Daphnia magna TaxID=35525 RepID=UPI001E1BD3EB|nr:aminopeptidase N [Daphnia magna]
MKAVLLGLLLAAVFAIAVGELLQSTKEESRWWYAPSRKAPLYEHKYQGLRERLVRAAAAQTVNMRLPRDVLPSSYTIRLLPFIEEGNFTTDGYIEILIDCKTATSNISMNAAELDIMQESIQVVDNADNIKWDVEKFYDEQNPREIITINLKKPLVVGSTYKISMKFISYLNEDLRGFYRSTYVENNVTKYLAVSQMEAPDARRAFPCFDEPNMKANFTITVGRKTSMSAISNMPLRLEEPIPNMPDYVWNHFKPSVKMSSYLVAMMVSEFVSELSNPSLSPDVEFKIWARPSFRNQTKYSADIGPRILNEYVTKYFQIEFPLPKVDMAAIPDFAAGAMENWGLITYRETDLLYDERRSSASAKQRVAIIIAHELAHQWFGNLVTMDWWNVIWLNEGFASYMEYPGTDYVEPGFEMNEQFTVTDLHYVFGIDALETSRPIDFEVNTPSQINQMFDAISYEKGSCIIRMCANFLGEPVFRRGVTSYLNKNAYGNTVQKDLWDALNTQAVNENVQLPATVETIMETWTRQMGYPVINISRLYDSANSAVASQQRFLLMKNENSSDKNDYSWWVPLTYTKDFTDIRKHWMPSGSGANTIQSLPGSSANWVIFNVGQEGYYRVVYDERNIEMIRNQLMTNHLAISKKNRAQILDDYLNMARANLTTYVTAMELTRYLAHERDYAPWTAASVALDYIDIMFYGYPDEQEWKNYMTVLVTALYDHVKYEASNSDAHLTVFTRSQAVSWACGRLNVINCITKANRDYQAWMTDATKELQPNLRRLISCTAIAEGGRPEWEFGFNRYLDSTLANEKTELLRAITCSLDVGILNEMLNRMITPSSGIRLQDANTLFSNIAANPVGHGVALDFLINRWDDVVAYFGNYEGFGGDAITRLFRALCNRVNNDEKLEKLTKLSTDHSSSFNSASARQGLELAQTNVRWVKKHYGTIVNWLKSQNSATEGTTVTSLASTTTPSTVATTPSSAARAFVNHFFILMAAIATFTGF